MGNETPQLVRKVEAVLPPFVGACVLVVDGSEVAFRHAWGIADIESEERCTPESNFRMASVSKQFTAAAVMLLVERGELDLDHTLDRFFPSFPLYGRGVTVKHLLTHTSGIPSYEELIPGGTTLQLSDMQVLELLLEKTEPEFAAGKQFEYSNSAYVLLGLIVEIVAERPYHTFVQQELFKALGMTQTVVYQRGLNQVHRRVYGHEFKDGHWVRADQSITSATRGDGCVYTSLDDYRLWLEAIETELLLGRSAWQTIFTPHVVSNRGGSRYGFGWFLDEYRGQTRIHHNGDTRGFRLCVQRFPNLRAAVLVQLNGELDDATWPMTRVGERVADIVLFGEAGGSKQESEAWM